MNVNATQAATQTLASAANAKTTAGSEFNMFLKLLTTQMQNQDPLDPMKSSEYTQQLAQYSQIEQTVQQSGTLKDILARLSSQDVAQASGLIGRDAVFSSAIAGLGAGPATWDYNMPAAGRNVVASIADSSGRVVDTRTLPDGTSGSFAWDGVMASGARAPNGAYTLSIAAANVSGTAVPATVTSTGRVSDVSMVNGALALGVNGVALPVSSLIRVAAAG